MISQLFPVNLDVAVAGMISVLFAFLLWSIKETYKRYGDEAGALKRIEIILARNLASNSVNRSYFDEWLKSLRINRLYRCSFRSYFAFEHEYSAIGNLELVNMILKIDFAYSGLASDLNMLSKNYSDTSDKFLESDNVKEWFDFNANTLEKCEEFKVSFAQAEDDTKDAVAYVRAYYQQKKRTPYGFVHMVLSRNLFPKVSSTVVADERRKLEEELAEKRMRHETSLV